MIDLKFCETASYHFADFFARIISTGSPASGGSAQLSNVTLLGFFEFSISAWVPRASPDPPQTTKTHDSKVQVGQKKSLPWQNLTSLGSEGIFASPVYNKGGGQFHPLITPSLCSSWCSLRWFLASRPPINHHFLSGAKNCAKICQYFSMA